jgi:predicted phosphodiesterase
MPNPRLSRELAEQAVAWIQECVNDGFSLSGHPSAFSEAARRHGLDDGTLGNRYRRAEELYGLKAEPRPPAENAPVPDRMTGEVLAEAVRSALIQSPRTLSELVSRTGSSMGAVLDALEDLGRTGTNLYRVGDRFEIPKVGQPSWTKGTSIEIVSRPDNTFVFGVAGDKHIASKYHRDDVLADLYRRFEAADVDAIFDTGNWIDGEARFNRYDIIAHGLDAQARLLAELHPRIAGKTTYAVWGDDHEGWYAQREGVDVGKYAEQIMQSAGHAWHDLGFMEAHVVLKNVNTGATARMAVCHPGGGSAYATSYAPQKAIEALEGGEKPAVALFGHWHKLEALNIRNVWAIQTGCCQDQTPFARKRRLDFHVGGLTLRLEQDPETGAIIGCAPEMHRYFVRSYYNGRWSHTGDVGRPERTRAGI